jgi:hypothetical protein
MNDSKTLQIRIESFFEELPGELSVSMERVRSDRLSVPPDLFEPGTLPPDAMVFNAVNPIIAIPDTDNSFTIIDGCKRYAHAKENNRPLLPAMVIRTPCDAFTRGILRIALNMHRPAYLHEQFLFFSWLRKNCPEERFESTACKAGFSYKNITQLSKLMTCEKYVKEAVFEGILDLSLIELFMVFNAEDQRCFLNAFKEMKLSLQTQREWLDWLPEIAYTGKTSISEIISEPEIKEILENTTLNGPQKIQKIRILLYKCRFPRFSEALARWKKEAAACNPDPAHVSFIPHPNFEKNRLTISITVTESEQAAEICKKLATLSQEQWQTLLYPVQKN